LSIYSVISVTDNEEFEKLFNNLLKKLDDAHREVYSVMSALFSRHQITDVYDHVLKPKIEKDCKEFILEILFKAQEYYTEHLWQREGSWIPWQSKKKSKNYDKFMDRIFYLGQKISFYSK